MNHNVYTPKKETILRLIVSLLLLGCLTVSSPGAAAQARQRLPLDRAEILISATEPSYVQYGARDLAFLPERKSRAIALPSAHPTATPKASVIIVVGEQAAATLGAALGSANDLGKDGFVIRSSAKAGAKIILVAGGDPHGTNTGIATFMQMIQVDGKFPYLEHPVDMRSKPSFSLRGIHLNGWPVNYPYSFRSWKEEDWKRFVDIAWDNGSICFSSGLSWRSCRFHCPRRMRPIYRRCAASSTTRRTSAAWKFGLCSRRIGSPFPIAVLVIPGFAHIGSMIAKKT